MTFKNDFKKHFKNISKRQENELKIIQSTNLHKHIGIEKFQTILMTFKNDFKK